MRIQSIILLLLLSACGAVKTETKPMNIEFEKLTDLPPAAGKEIQVGLAGVLSGCDGNHIIVAGGSNFEDHLPWRGGTKLYHDEIYVLTMGKDNSLNWSQSWQRLPQPMAYSANVPAGKGFICIGGEDMNKKLEDVFRIFTDGDSVNLEMLPALPVALSNSGAALIGSKLFVAGGLDSKGAADCFLSLDLATNDIRWTNLPVLPQPLSHAVVVSQSDGKEECIYVLGGRNKTGITSVFLTDIWKYAPSSNKWIKAGTLQLNNQPAFGLSAGTGLSFGDHWIILFGGDKGIVFNQTEQINDLISKTPDGTEKERLLNEKDQFLSNHIGFSKEILAFNTLTGELQKVGEFPGFSQVTTNSFWWNNKIIIPSGEIRPGVRTPFVNSIKIESE